MLLPDNQHVSAFTPIYPGSHFTWGEATKNCTRPLQDLIIDNKVIISAGEIQNKIINTAKSLDKIRRLLGDRPIIVNSWFRPQHINTYEGGAKLSRHQYGDAVDVCSNYLSPQQIYKILTETHSGGLGRYYNFVHLDWRSQKARWSA